MRLVSISCCRCVFAVMCQNIYVGRSRTSVHLLSSIRPHTTPLFRRKHPPSLELEMTVRPGRHEVIVELDRKELRRWWSAHLRKWGLYIFFFFNLGKLRSLRDLRLSDDPIYALLELSLYCISSPPLGCSIQIPLLIKRYIWIQHYETFYSLGLRQY